MTRCAPTPFSIPQIHEHLLLETRPYKGAQLKEIARHYKLKVSGKKSELKERIQHFMRTTLAARRFQACWSDHIARRYVRSKGPAYLRPSICVNETDFFTLDGLGELPPEQLFSYRDHETKQVYGFDIRSLHLLFVNGDDATPNPYTRQPFPAAVRQNLRFILRHAAKCHENVVVTMDPEETLSPEKRQEMTILALFQHMDSLGNYTDQQWYSTLGRGALIKFIRELADIWSYRAQLSHIVKRQISPPMGDPFRGINLLALPTLTPFELRDRGVQLIERLVTRGIDDAHKCLGTNYVLCALTLANENAAEAMPWLYQSVA